MENLGSGTEVKLVDERDADGHLFPHNASPFRTRDDAPPKISWTHIWGTMKWGKRAGAWGKGVEGLEERNREGGIDNETKG